MNKNGYSVLLLSLTLIVAAAVAPVQAFAQTAPSPGQFRSVLEYANYEIKADGTYVAEAMQAISPVGSSDVQQVSQVVLPFQAGVMEIEILEAYTLKADGRKIQVSPDKIITQGIPTVEGSTVFSDMQVKVLLYPDVAVGDQVVCRIRKRLVKPPIPGRFNVIHFFPKSIAYGDVRIRLKVPKSLPLNYEVVGFREASSREEGDTLSKEWAYSNETAVPEEKDSVDILERSPRIAVSSFRGWDDVAQSIQTLMEKKPAASEDIRNLADEITKGCVTERECAEAIYQWVSSQIRYVVVILGANGYAPNDSSSILENRYGDCKDKAKILCELLEAKGIECSPVLISAGNSYALPGVPTLLTFNHMICYLPGLGVYLDPSEGVLPFGVLREQEADKPVIHTRNFQEIKYTPRMMAEKAVLSVKTNISANEDGSASGQTDVRGKSEIAAEMRLAMSKIGSAGERRNAFVTNSLNLVHQTGDGKLNFDEPRGHAPEYGYRVDFKLKNYLGATEKGGNVPVVSRLFSILPIRQTLSPLNAPEEKVNHLSMNLTIVEEITIQFPASIKISRLPKGVEFSNSVGSYKSTYRKRDQTVHVVRRLVQQYPHAWRTPEEGAALREISDVARRDLSAAVQFQKGSQNPSGPASQ